MLKKILIGSVFAGVLAVSPLAAEVFVRAAAYCFLLSSATDEVGRLDEAATSRNWVSRR